MRQLVADTFERLVLYVRGARPSDAEDAPIELLLISRAGQARMLTLDRWTGELLAGDHVIEAENMNEALDKAAPLVRRPG